MNEGEEWQRQLIEAVGRLEKTVCQANPRHRWDIRKRLVIEFVSGIARGIGFSIGFTLLGALLLYALRNIALANLPVIGKFLADIVRIVENYL